MKQTDIPIRKRLKRSERLSMTKEWIKLYEGKNLIKGYARWFGVDRFCALTELKLSGISFPVEVEQPVLNSKHRRIECKKRNKQSKSQEANIPFDSDENFSVIIGYTSNGIPYGITYEEWDKGDSDQLTTLLDS